MSLRDIVLPKRKIVVGNEIFEVKGLSGYEVTRLVDSGLKELDSAIELFKSKMPSDQSEIAKLNLMDVFGGIVVDAIRSSPKLAARIISLAAEDDSDEGIAVAESLPVDVQISALVDIFELTFSSHGGLKKLISIVLKQAEGRTVLEAEKQAISTGI